MILRCQAVSGRSVINESLFAETERADRSNNIARWCSADRSKVFARSCNNTYAAIPRQRAVFNVRSDCGSVREFARGRDARIPSLRLCKRVRATTTCCLSWKTVLRASARSVELLREQYSFGRSPSFPFFFLFLSTRASSSACAEFEARGARERKRR